MGLLQSAKVVEAIAPTTQTTDAAIVGNIIDRASYGAVEFAIYSGTLTTSAATYTPSLEHGDAANLSDTAAATTQLIGALADAAFTGANDNKAFSVGYAGSKRYVRLTVTPSGNAGAACTVGALAILSKPAFSVGKQSQLP